MLKEVTINYPNSKTLNLNFSGGPCQAIVGSAQSGKTTLLQSMYWGKKLKRINTSVIIKRDLGGKKLVRTPNLCDTSSNALLDCADERELYTELYNLKHQSSYGWQELKKYWQQLFPNSQIVTTEFDFYATTPYGKDKITNLHSAYSPLLLLCELLRNSKTPKVVLIDNLGLLLPPRQQSILLDIIRDHCSKCPHQVIFTTNSTVITHKLGHSDIHLLAPGPVCVRLDQYLAEPPQSMFDLEEFWVNRDWIKSFYDILLND